MIEDKKYPIGADGLPNRPQITQEVLDIITRTMDKQDEKGINKYGETIDDAKDYDWYFMALEELADCVKYQQKEINRLRKFIKDNSCPECGDL